MAALVILLFRLVRLLRSGHEPIAVENAALRLPPADIRADTVLRWQRERFRKFWATSPGGRQPVAACGSDANALYSTPSPAARACFHNLAAVMPLTELARMDSVVEDIDTFVSIRPERCSFSASLKLVTALSASAANELLQPVPSALHSKPDGYNNALGYRRDFGAFSLGFHVFAGPQHSILECDFDTSNGLERLCVVEHEFHDLITPRDMDNNYCEGLKAPCPFLSALDCWKQDTIPRDCNHYVTKP
jgi:hypothetical protein